jgi:hypothetical protein
MHIVYSKTNESNIDNEKVKKPKPAQSEFARQMAFKSFKKACEENADRIARIQEYFPGWEPVFYYTEK